MVSEKIKTWYFPYSAVWLQLNELNKNGEMRVTGKRSCALRVSNHPRMCRSRRPAAVIELGSHYCLHNNQPAVPLGHAADNGGRAIAPPPPLATLLNGTFFSPKSGGDLRSDAHQSQIIGGDADVDHTQIIGWGIQSNYWGDISPHNPRVLPPFFKEFISNRSNTLSN